MSNRREYLLPELELPLAQVREALQCLLHTILFVRAPGSVAPVDVHLEDFDLSYSKIDADKEQRSRDAQAGGPRNESTGRPQQLQQHSQAEQGQNYVNPSSQYEINAHPKENEIDKRVDDIIDLLLQSMTPVGPELSQGGVMLSFFEKRASKQLFGLVNHEEKVIFESWIIKVVVSSRDTITPRPHQDHAANTSSARSQGNIPMTDTGLSSTVLTANASALERQRVRDIAEQMLRAAMLQIFDKAGESLDHIPPVMYQFELTLHNKPVYDYRESIRSRVTNMPAIIKINT